MTAGASGFAPFCSLIGVSGISSSFGSTILTWSGSGVLGPIFPVGSHGNILVTWFSTVNHESIYELHRLSTLSSQFTRHDYFTTLGTALHDESQNSITGSSYSETSNELVT